jgi:hypothetical protein
MSLNLDIDSLPPEKVEALVTRLETMKAQRAAENKLAHYRPYPKQAAFHEAGAKHRERLLMCANRFGKTMCGAAELAFHLTGDYPEWWNGKRFDQPVRAWAAGVTGKSTRDVLQEKLIGPPFRESEWGTGMIPKAAIAGVATSPRYPGRNRYRQRPTHQRRSLFAAVQKLRAWSREMAGRRAGGCLFRRGARRGYLQRRTNENQ